MSATEGRLIAHRGVGVVLRWVVINTHSWTLSDGDEVEA